MYIRQLKGSISLRLCDINYASITKFSYAGQPHVCTERQAESVKVQKPCIRAYTQMTKVWKPNCGHHSWCLTYEPRTVYYTGYTDAYETQYNAVAKCCNGWIQKNDEPGCFYRMFKFI
ncbi:multiple epidermal growth factor-like domains protein 6 [Trichonephila clavipes]|nr:multiple epidermal growth factor-like domains protein 6 [Trichonephila clavipes]